MFVNVRCYHQKLDLCFQWSAQDLVDTHKGGFSGTLKYGKRLLGICNICSLLPCLSQELSCGESPLDRSSVHCYRDFAVRVSVKGGLSGLESDCSNGVSPLTCFR